MSCDWTQSIDLTYPDPSANLSYPQADSALGVSGKLTEGALHPLNKIIDKSLKQKWPWY